jgi:preprotein translocase SecE subunit
MRDDTTDTSLVSPIRLWYSAANKTPAGVLKNPTMSNPMTAVRDYVTQSVAELKKVSWPSRDMTMRYAILVIGISVAMAAFFATLDFGLRQGVNATFSGVRTTAPAAPAPEVTPITEEAPAPTDVAPPPASGGDISLPPIQVTN